MPHIHSQMHRLPALLLAIVLATSLDACGGDGRAPIATEPPVPPTPPAATLSSIVDSVRVAFSMPAMGAAIVTMDEGTTAIAVSGLRRATGGAPVTTSDLWHLGSNTKAFTSMLAAVAVSQNRIAWTTTIAQAFPELTNIRAEYRDVTLRELLSHQSGLAGIPGGAPPESATTPTALRAAMVTSALQQPPFGARGTFSYNNVGYVVAGAMLERAFGTSYEAAVATHIFTPLGMTDAAWGPQAATGSTTQPVAHRLQSNGSWSVLEGFDLPPVFNSSGTMHMSLASWARFVRETLRVEAGTSSLVPAAIARETTSPAVTVNPTTSYGMGWSVSTRAWANGKVLFHDGTNLGNVSLAYLAPVRNVAILVTANGYDEKGRAAQALDALSARLVTFHTTGK